MLLNVDVLVDLLRENENIWHVTLAQVKIKVPSTCQLY